MTPATATLAEFLLQRIAEDEDERVIPEGDPGWPFRRTPEEIAESDRWRAECEAKRRIVALHAGHHECPRDAEPENDIAGLFGDDDPCPTLRALALPFADHPDYRPEWRP